MANKVEVRITATNAASPALKQVSEQLGQVGASAKGASTGLNQAANSMANAGRRANESASSWSRVATSLRGIAGVAVGAFGLTALASTVVDVTRRSIQLGMQSVETANLFTVSMGKMARAGETWATNMARSYGLAEANVKRTLGTFQMFNRTMTGSEDVAYQMSKSLTQLTYDWASFVNVPIEEAFTRIQSAMAGETESVRRWGIDVSDAAIQAYALNHAIATQANELTQAQKAMIRYNLLVEQSTLAQGDLARTIMSPANQLRILEERIAALETKAGRAGLPSVGRGLQFVNEDVLVRLDVAADRVIGLGQAIGSLQGGRGGVSGAIGRALFGNADRPDLVQGFEELPDKINEVGAALDGLANKVPVLREFTGVWLQIVRMTNPSGIPSGLANIFDQILGSGQLAAAQAIARTQQTIAQGYRDVGAAAADAIGPETIAIEKIKAAARAAEEGAKSAGAAIRESTTSLPNYWDPAILAVQAYTRNLNNAAEATARLEAETAARLPRIIEAMVAQNPAARRAADDVTRWEGAIENVSLAIEANRDQQDAAQRSMQATQQRLSDINDELAKQKSHLSDLQSIRLPGMGAADAAQQRVEDQIKRLQLQQLALYSGGNVDRKGDLRGGAKRRYDDIQRQINDKQRQLQRLQLQYSLKYDAQVKAIQTAAKGGAPKERSYADYMKDVAETLKKITDLEARRDEETKRLDAQKKIMDDLNQKGRDLAKTQQDYNDKLRDAKDAQDKVNEGLRTAYTLLGSDIERMEKLGLISKDQATQLKNAATGLLQEYQDYAKGIVEGVGNDLQTLKAMVDAAVLARQADRDAANRPISQRQFGGPVYPGGSYLVGERGPELFAPRRAGDILPLAGVPSAGGSSRSLMLNAPLIGNVTVRDEADEDRLVRKMWRMLTSDFEASRREGVR